MRINDGVIKITLMTKKLIFLVLPVLFLTLSSGAQSLEQIDTELADIYMTIDKYGSYGSDYDEEKLAAANAAMIKALRKYGGREDVLRHELPKASDAIFIITSKDGNLRTYSWDASDGGTMHNFYVVYQYRGKDGKIHVITPDEDDHSGGSFVSEIFALKTASGPIYLLVSNAILSTSLNTQSIKAMRINGSQLEKQAKVIRTKEGLTNTVGFEFDFFSVVDRPERPLKLFQFDEKRKEFRFPVVIESDKFIQGEVTNRFIKYRFNGKEFVNVR